MKKHRLFFLSFVSIFCLALPACDMLLPKTNRNKSSLKESDSSQLAESSSSMKSSSRSSSTNTESAPNNHHHEFGDWISIIPPTCVEYGKDERTCTICGEKEYRDVEPYGHQFYVVENNATCEQGGYITYRCALCDEIHQEYRQSDHFWDGFRYIEPISVGLIGYDISRCNNCQKRQIVIPAINGTLLDGSKIKSGTPEGFMKLDYNNSSISWTFNLDESLFGWPSGCTGTLYQRAMIDGWPSNAQASYSKITNGYDYTNGNFKVEVNGVAIDKTQYMTTTFEEMTLGGEPSDDFGSNYSPLALCPIGQVTLHNGVNEIVYTRLSAYTMIVSDLVMVVSENIHEHSISSGESSIIGDASAYECSICHRIIFDLDLAKSSLGSQTGKLKADAFWNITGLPNGQYSVQICACVSSTTSLNQSIIVDGVGRYQWRVDSNDYVNPMNEGTYGDYGFAVGSSYDNCKWSKVCCYIDIDEASTRFEMHYTGKGYSAFVSAVRLIKVDY